MAPTKTCHSTGVCGGTGSRMADHRMHTISTCDHTVIAARDPSGLAVVPAGIQHARSDFGAK